MNTIDNDFLEDGFNREQTYAMMMRITKASFNFVFPLNLNTSGRTNISV